METNGIVFHARFERTLLQTCIDAGWIAPQAGDQLSELDAARLQLIHELRRDMGVNDEGISIILHLLDQVHGLRGTLRAALTALGTRSESTPQE